MSKQKSKIYLMQVIESHYCKLVFIFSFILAYLLIPRTVSGIFYYLSIIFMVTFSLVMTCIIRNIKENIRSSKTKQGSLITFIATILGISAFQVCGASFACGASIGMAILAAILPSTFISLINEYSSWIIVVSIIFQVASLYYMKCFESPDNKLILSKVV